MRTISNWTDMNLLERIKIREEEISEIKRRFFESKVIIPEDNIVELSDVAWQEDRNSRGNPIGYVLVNNASDSKRREFIFAYSKLGLEIARGKGFRNLTAFPDINKVYVSKQTIFPTFLTKLPQKAREDLRGKGNNDTDLLIRFSGVITDDFILVPPGYFGKNAREESSRVILSNVGTINTENNFVPRPNNMRIIPKVVGGTSPSSLEDYGDK